MEFKKVLYASVVLDQNGHGVLHVVFSEPQPAFNRTLTPEEAAVKEDGSYYWMDKGVMHSCHIKDGKINGPTYAYVMNDHFLVPCIDVTTYLDVGYDRVCIGEKQISVQFAEHILSQFNLPFMIKKNASNGITYEIIPNRETLDSLIGNTYLDTNAVDFTITWFHLPNREGWNPMMICGISHNRSRQGYRSWNDLPDSYPGIIGRDETFHDVTKWYPDKRNDWIQ